jgi:hypothetical protein
MAVLKELENAIPPPPSTIPLPPSLQTLSDDQLNENKGSNIFTTNGDKAYSNLPRRYVLVAAGNGIKCFMGLQESFEFTLSSTTPGNDSEEFNQGSDNLPDSGSATPSESRNSSSVFQAGLHIPNLEILSIDAFERKDSRGSQLVLIVAVAKV